MIAPTKETYVRWYEQRLARTREVATQQSRISGRQVLEENLSVSLLSRLGFVLNTQTDTLEKTSNG